MARLYDALRRDATRLERLELEAYGPEHARVSHRGQIIHFFKDPVQATRAHDRLQAEGFVVWGLGELGDDIYCIVAQEGVREN
jgi:hypothetical protein